MIRRLAECTASYFVRNGIVDSSEEDVYRYGIEVMLCDVVDYMIVLLSGIIFGRLIEAIWFYSNFLIIDRKSTRLNSSHANESRMPSSA